MGFGGLTFQALLAYPQVQSLDFAEYLDFEEYLNELSTSDHYGRQLRSQIFVGQIEHSVRQPEYK
jgi:hypothetical protein